MDISECQLQPGYWELRINWSDNDLMRFTPEEFKEFKELSQRLHSFFNSHNEETPKPVTPHSGASFS